MAKADSEAPLPEIACTDCDRAFSRPAALGAHRRRAHGIVGTSRTAVVSRLRVADGQLGKQRGAGRARSSIDRDALLGVLFPDGIPAREAVLRETNRWLDQAERLAAISH